MSGKDPYKVYFQMQNDKYCQARKLYIKKKLGISIILSR